MLQRGGEKIQKRKEKIYIYLSFEGELQELVKN